MDGEIIGAYSHFQWALHLRKQFITQRNDSAASNYFRTLLCRHNLVLSIKVAEDDANQCIAFCNIWANVYQCHWYFWMSNKQSWCADPDGGTHSDSPKKSITFSLPSRQDVFSAIGEFHLIGPFVLYFQIIPWHVPTAYVPKDWTHPYRTGTANARRSATLSASLWDTVVRARSVRDA